MAVNSVLFKCLREELILRIASMTLTIQTKGLWGPLSTAGEKEREDHREEEEGRKKIKKKT